MGNVPRCSTLASSFRLSGGVFSVSSHRSYALRGNANSDALRPVDENSMLSFRGGGILQVEHGNDRTNA
jgi:hypothetical protein